MAAFTRFPASQKSAAVALVLIVAAVFACSFDFQLLQWDDHRMLVTNPHLASLSAPNLRWMLTDTTYNRLYMPLGWLAYALSILALGYDPSAHHALNVLLHMLSTLLVFALLQHILRLVARPPPSDAPIEGPDPTPMRIAFVFALLWSLHPLRVEVVAWVAARVHAQAALLTLASVLCYLRAAEKSDGKPVWRTPLFWASVILYAIGLLSFPAGLMLPAILVVLDVYLLKRASIIRLALEKLPFFLIAAVPLIVSLLGREFGTIYKPAAAMSDFGLADRVVQGLFVWADLALVQFWPIHLSPVYARLIHFDIASPVILAGAIFTLAATALTFANRRRYPLLWATWLCHLFLLVPFLGLTEHPHVAADRYTYLDGILWAAFLAGVVNHLSAQPRRIFTRAAIAAAAVLAILTFAQLPVWRDSITLFDHMAAMMPGDPYRAQFLWRIANVRLDQRDYPSALRAADQAIAADGECSQAYAIKAAAQRRTGDIAGAEQTIAAARKLPATRDYKILESDSEKRQR